ncbi:MAG: anticodon nuclease [Planctomycetes bacterium]|nr:anticodon nuclease [Planctomycetota bacterium]
MSNKPKINKYANLRTLAQKLRSDHSGVELILIYAYNRTGKTRLSMEFKDVGKRKNNGDSDTLYFNAYTEDLFTWDNDLDGDVARHLRLNPDSTFFNGLKDLALDQTIAGYLSRYADFDFDIDYTNWKISFSKEVLRQRPGAEPERIIEANIKISRGEQNIFIWCLFMAICERMLDGHVSYQSKKYLYIDDPISSLDDNNAIAVACDLAQLLRRAASRKDQNREPAPIKVVFSSHPALFFNVMGNEIGRAKEGEPKVTHKRYFLHRPNGDGAYTLRTTEDTPFFHHVALLAELQMAADPATGKLYTFHFNALRSIMEKTASFFGHTDISFCLKALAKEEDIALYNRALNLLSHGKYAIHEPTEMGEDNKELFRRILRDFINAFKFSLPDLLETPPAVTASVPLLTSTPGATT